MKVVGAFFCLYMPTFADICRLLPSFAEDGEMEAGRKKAVQRPIEQLFLVESRLKMKVLRFINLCKYT